jgi:integrase
MKLTPTNQLPQQQDTPSGHRPLWELTPAEFAAYQVTPMSIAADPVWEMPSTTPGLKVSMCRLHWDMELLDGSRLTDPRHARRLAWAQKLMTLILNAPANGDVPAPGSLAEFQQGFRWLLSWMAARGMQNPGELDVPTYIDDLPRYIAECSDNDEISVGQVNRALRTLSWLWSERRGLARWGVPTFTENPFREHSIHHYAKAIATKAGGWIPPLPDEVAIPLFNQVAWWLGQPAEDVIGLLNYEDDPLTRPEKAGKGKSARNRRANRFLADFSFSTLPGESHPWHAALDYAYARDHGSPLDRVRLLFDAVRDACALSIQGMSGMRISELMGIEAGFDAVSGLPAGVRIEDSATGLYEAYIIRTVLSKTEKGLPREMDWVLGLRPKGSQEEPLPVRALRLLNRLYAPWRDRAKTTRLIMSGKGGNNLPLKHSALRAMSSERMMGNMKRFIARWVDLSGLPDESKHKIKDNDLVEWRESKGGIFRSHMLRKSWAQFMFAVDPRLMPAIQLQFHHLSMAMSDTGYIGSNLLLLNDMDSVATQARNLMILETVLGRNPLAGKMGEQLEQATKALAAKVKGLPTSDAYRVVVEFCEHAQLPIFFAPHGACMPLQTHEMRCHDEAGTSLLLRKQPNARRRQPSLCAGCSCFVLDARHSDFWAARYIDNWLAYKRAERSGDVGGYKVIKERAQQAGKLLKKIGIEVVQLDQQIEKTLESEHVPA